MPLVDDGKLSLSTTSVLTAMSCLKKFELRNIEHLIATPDRVSVPLRRGIWIHSCLEAIHRGKGWGHLLTDLAKWAREHGVAEEQIEDISHQVVQIISGYEKFWAETERYPMIPIASEVPLVLKLPSGDELTCTLDTIVEYRGQLGIVEHKSTQKFPDANWRTIDPQTALQYVICKATRAYDVQFVAFNYLSTYEPPVPRVTKGSKNEGPRFYSNEITTTSLAFERGAEELSKVWRGTQDEFVEYCEEKRSAMVQDAKFYAREFVYKPDALVVEVLRDVKWAMEAIRLAQSQNHFPRSISQMTCPRCTYSDLCPVEMMRGGVPSNLRQTLYQIEDKDSRREGRPDYDDAA